MRTRKIIILFLIVDLFLFGLFYHFFLRPIRFVEEEIDELKSFVPDWKKNVYISKTWRGRIYKSLFLKFSVYWNSPPDIEKSFHELEIRMKNAFYKEDLPLFEKGVFYYQREKKEEHNFIVLFLKKKRIYWITLSGFPLFTKDIEILRRFFDNLEVEREKVSRSFKEKFDSILRNLRIPKTEKGEFIFFLVSLIIIASELFIASLFYYMGKCPKEIDEGIIICSSNASIETRSTLQVQIQPACICLKHGFLVVFIGGKKSLEIPIDKVVWNIRKKHGRYEDKIFKIPELNEWRPYLPLREFTDK